MAQTKLERVGTIFTRVRNLLKSGAMNEEDKPLWYNVYKAFPPKYEPRFNRPADMTPVRQILYEEDLVRAKLHDRLVQVRINLGLKGEVSVTKKFLQMYEKNKKEATPGEDVFEKTIKQLQQKINVKTKLP